MARDRMVPNSGNRLSAQIMLWRSDRDHDPIQRDRIMV
jgi:hypothetical protein